MLSTMLMALTLIMTLKLTLTLTLTLTKACNYNTFHGSVGRRGTSSCDNGTPLMVAQPLILVVLTLLVVLAVLQMPRAKGSMVSS